MYKITVIASLLSLTNSLIGEEELIIPQGKLKGKVEQTWTGREFLCFLGIPYAKPPVGNLRFEAPVAAGGWEGTLDATTYKSDCPQMKFSYDQEIFGQEDCLYLNIYTPRIPSKGDKLLPVMFYIFGGGWNTGSGSDNKLGAHFLLNEDVVLIVFNYRLGPLGFLSTGDRVVPGNNGLKDQSLALNWTKEYISYFGGDSKRITTFGVSAGGANVHYLLLSPMTKDLIQGAILQSGLAVARWPLASKQFAENSTKSLAMQLNCPTSSSKEMVDCFKKAKVDELVISARNLYNWEYDPSLPFRPVVEPNVENAFLPADPHDIYKSGQVSRVPLLVSTTDDDGILKAAYIFNSSERMDTFVQNFEKEGPLMLLYHESNFQKQISEMIKKFYFGEEKLGWSNTAAFIKMFTDSWFLSPADETTRLHMKYAKAPVYQLLYGFRGTHTHGSIFGNNSCSHGAAHADDLLYLFQMKMFKWLHRTDLEKKMIHTMVKLWTNFAKTGNPTPESEDTLPKWKPVTNEGGYYHIDNNVEIKMVEENTFKDRINLWRRIRAFPTVKDEL